MGRLKTTNDNIYLMANFSKRVDFWIQHNPDDEKKAIKILDYAFLYRTEKKKQTVLVLTGDPGEAKSSIAQALTEKLLKNRGIDYTPYVSDVTVYTPFEFPEKERRLLEDPELKHIPIMIIDEARLVVKAKNWQDFLNQAIADVFALQRRVKQLMLIIVTQDLGDIDKDIRRLVTYWGECYRPLNGSAELHLSRFYKDTKDPEKIKLKKRGLKGIVQMPDGRQRLEFPSTFIFRMPSKEVWAKYDEDNFKNKGTIIKQKLEEMMDRMKKDIGLKEKSRENVLLNYYLTPEKYQELLFHFKTTNRGNYKLKQGAREILGLQPSEAKRFELAVKEKMKNFGEVIKNGVQK